MGFDLQECRGKQGHKFHFHLGIYLWINRFTYSSLVVIKTRLWVSRWKEIFTYMHDVLEKIHICLGFFFTKVTYEKSQIISGSFSYILVFLIKRVCNPNKLVVMK